VVPLLKRKIRIKRSQGDKCPVCGASLGKNMLECEACHTKLGKKIEPEKNLCKACGAILERNAPVCHSCGAEFGEVNTSGEASDERQEAVIDSFTLIPGIDRKKAEHLYSMGFHNLLDLIGESLGSDGRSAGLKRELAANVLAQRDLPKESSQKRCPECDILIDEQDKVCRACGTVLAEEEIGGKDICPYCNTLLSLDAIFCYACGRAIKDYDEVSDKEFEQEKQLLRKGLLHMMDNIMDKLMIYCPICKEKNNPSSYICIKCGSLLESEEREYSIRQFMSLPGIGRDQAELLYRRGYRDLIDLVESLLDEDAKARGIGYNLEKKIMLSKVKMMDGDKPGEIKVVCPKCRTMQIFISGEIMDCKACKYKKYDDGECEVCVYKKSDDKKCNICNAILKAEEELETEIEDIKKEIGRVVEDSQDMLRSESDIELPLFFLPTGVQDMMVENFTCDEIDEINEVLMAVEEEIDGIPEAEKKELARVEKQMTELIDEIIKSQASEAQREELAKMEEELEELMNTIIPKKPDEGEEEVEASESLKKGLYFATVLLKTGRDLKLKIRGGLDPYRQAVTAVKLKQYQKAIELTEESVSESIKAIKDGQKTEVIFVVKDEKE
jgi:hypothetical protein